MKAKFFLMSMILMLGLGQGCRASFQNVDKNSDLNGEPSPGAGANGEGDGLPGQGDQNPNLEPTPNPIDGVDATPDPKDPVDPNDPGKGDPVDPIDGGKGKISLTVTLPQPSIKMGERQIQATAKLNTQTEPPRVRWSIAGPADQTVIGTIDKNGIYTSPKTINRSFPINVIATLIADPKVIGMAPLLVEPLDNRPTLTVTLPSPEIKAGEEKMQATARLSTQTEPPLVTWTIMGPPGRSDIGSINASGVYTSPKKTVDEFPVVITATLISDPSIAGHANLKVLPNDQIFARCTRGNTVFPILADVYRINSTATKIPDFTKPSEARKVTTVCMDKYAVAPRNFDAGFPDVPDLFEWFALNTKTQIIIPQDGNYTFYLNSDDGSKLYINDSLVIDNDFLHQAMGTDPQDSPNSGQKEATLFLLKGVHDLRLDYFQGPKYRLALELKWKKPGSSAIGYVPRDSFK